MIPSQDAMRYVSHQLRSMQHRALKDAIVFMRDEEGKSCAESLRLQAHDMAQVAQFLEERLVKQPAKHKGKAK